MNLPNKLTLFRVLLIPIFIILYFLVDSPWYACGVFILAALTDTADGMIARKYNLVTNFGKFADPLADKVLVCSALICMVDSGVLASWIVIIIIAREFIISGFRLVAANNNLVIAASFWGKVKTTVQMLMIICLIINFDIPWFRILCQVLIYAAVVLTVVSLGDYLWRNRKVLSDNADK